MLRRCLVILLTIMLLNCGRSAFAQQAARSPLPVPDLAADVTKAIESYVVSFNAKDAKQLVELWSGDAVYIDRSTGEQFMGRPAIEAEFQKVFANAQVPELTVQTDSIDFISPNVALALGTATASLPGAEPIQSDYSVVYVKRDGQWLIDRITEDEIAVAEPRHAVLKQLEFMIGEWSGEQNGVVVEISCQWTENEAYISSAFKVISGSRVQSSGLQIIGWDPSSNQIRSWLFDSSGTFVSGSWASRDDKWIVQCVATLSDGGYGSFTSVYRPQADGSYTWGKMNQVLDGQLLPNADETIFQRK